MGPGALVFVGGTDKYEYAYLDTLYVILWVENRTDEEVTLWPTTWCCRADFMELWCPPAGDESHSCVPVYLRQVDCFTPLPPTPHLFR